MKIGTQTFRLFSGCGAEGLSGLFPSLAARDHSSTSSATCYYQEAHKMAKDPFNSGASQGYDPYHYYKEYNPFSWRSWLVAMKQFCLINHSNYRGGKNGNSNKACVVIWERDCEWRIRNTLCMVYDVNGLNWL
jgi:hypothetical protein